MAKRRSPEKRNDSMGGFDSNVPILAQILQGRKLKSHRICQEEKGGATASHRRPTDLESPA